MNRYVICVAAMLALLSSRLVAQEPALPLTAKLPEIAKAYEQYFSREGKGKGSGYRQYKRRAEFDTPRMYPAGDQLNIPALTWLHHYQAERSAQFALQKSAAAAAGITAKWEPVRPANDPRGPDAGRIDAIAFDPIDPAVVYIGTPHGGVWRTRDNGVTWTSLTDSLPMLAVSDIAVDPLEPRTIYVLTGDGDGGSLGTSYASASTGIIKSVDGGQTWQDTGLVWKVNQINHGHRLAIHPKDPNILLAATSAGLLRTIDGWKTWTTVLRAPTQPNGRRNEFWDVQFHPTDPSIVYAATNTGVYRSVDTGQTWSSPLTGGLPENPNSTRIRLAVSPAAPDTLYALYAARDGFSVGLYRSDNRGDTFARRSYSNPRPADLNNPPPFDFSKPNILHEANNYIGGQAPYDLAMTVSPTNIDRVHVGGLDTWRSDDGGRTWKITSVWTAKVGSPNYTHADIHHMAYRGETLYTASDGGLYRSNDGGDTWTSIAHIPGAGIRMIYSICLTPQDPDLLFYGSQDNGTWRLRLDGQLDRVLSGDGMVCQINSKDRDTVYASVYSGYILKTLDSQKEELDWGPDWSRISPRAAGEGAWVTPYILDADDPDIIYGCYADLWMSPDGGAEWKNLSKGAFGPSNQCMQVALAPSDPKTIYVAKRGNWSSWNRPGEAPLPPFLGGGGVFRSTDGGQTWQTITGNLPLADAALRSLAVSPTDPRRAWVTFSGYGSDKKVFGTIDGGRTWNNLSAGLPNLPVNVVVAQKTASNAIYVGTDAGVFYRDDRLSTWLPFSDGLPNSVVSTLAIDEARGRMFAGTFGRGIWVTEMPKPCEVNCNSPLQLPDLRTVTAAPQPPRGYTGPAEIFE